ncbi:MAG: DinB family protein [Candidatus Promineifilaceae bacterium]
MQAPPPIPNLLFRLEKFAANVKATLTEQETEQWQKRPSPDQWSLTEVVCHLRDVEREVYHVRYKSLISADNAFISGVSPDEWAEERGYAQQDGRQALQAFLEARQETLDILKGMSAELWQRQAQHAFFGPTSMRELVYLSVRHDDLHWEQINSLLIS